MNPKRSGFTLVEMMVAMALTIFIMIILSQAFIQGLETFSGLKSIGDMQEELRAATTLLKNDLSMDHFEGKRRLSDPLQSPLVPFQQGFFYIRQGSEVSPPVVPLPGTVANYTNEGNDGDNLPSFRATDHILHFTVKARGNRTENFFSAPIDNTIDPFQTLLGKSTNSLLNAMNNADGTARDSVLQLPNSWIFSTQWAEVAYFLVRTGTVSSPTDITKPIPGSPTPLWALYRCQYAIVPDTSNVNPLATGIQAKQLLKAYYQFACKEVLMPDPANPNKLKENLIFANPTSIVNRSDASPAQLALGSRTFDPNNPQAARTYNSANPGKFGANLILSNVISFQVQIMKSSDFSQFQDLTSPATQPFKPNSMIPKPPPPNPVEWDTSNIRAQGSPNLQFQAVYPNSGNLPTLDPPFGIVAVQITLRIWDPRSQLTRQVTLMQEM